jgi:hypothetical protein
VPRQDGILGWQKGEIHMDRFERCLLYGMSVLVVSGLVASGLAGSRGQSAGAVVHAADVHDNAKLDVLRRAVSFAQETCIKEGTRSVDLQKSPISGERLMSKGAAARAKEWGKIEAMLLGLFDAEVREMMKEAGVEPPARR